MYCKANNFTTYESLKKYFILKILYQEVDFMNKEAEISILLDVYGGILSKIQFDSIDLYYNQDLSLSEISYHTGKSRQGVRDSIKRSESTLINMEASLGFLKKTRQLKTYVNSMKDIIIEMEDKLEDSCLKDKVNSLKDIINKLDSI